MPDRSVLIRSAIALAALVASTALYAAPTVTGMQLISEMRVSRTVFDYTYKVTIQNDATARQDVAAQVATVGAGTSIQDGAVTVGGLAANQQVTPTDTVTLRHDRLQPFSQAAISWTFTGTEVSPLPSGNPPQGILVPGSPTASLSTAMPDYEVPNLKIPLSEIATDTETGNRIVRTALHVAFREDATVAEANSFLNSINGRIAISIEGVEVVSVRIPDPGSLEALYALIEAIEAHPAVDVVLPDILLQQGAVPAPSYISSELDHHLAIRAAAAWNARQALIYPSSNRPAFVIFDNFGMGVPLSPDTQVVWPNQNNANSFFSTSCLETDKNGQLTCNGHGYSVAGIVAGSFGGIGPDENVTGMYPSEVGKKTELPGYGIDVNLLAAIGRPEKIVKILRNIQKDIENNAIPSKRIVLNTSWWWDKISDSNSIKAGVLWLRMLRRGQARFQMTLEDRLFHAAIAGNGEGSPAPNVAPWNPAALWDQTILGVKPTGNTLVVENRMVIPGSLVPVPTAAIPGCLHHTSNRQGNISAIGSRQDPNQEGVTSFALPGLGTRTDFGTSYSAPQVAGLAAYLWTLRPDLTGPQVAQIIKAHARQPSSCSEIVPQTPAIDAYATILSADEGFTGKHPARLAILDVSGHPPLAEGDGVFDELDTQKFLDAIFADTAGQAIDYSRYDLNGDGFTGGSGTEKINLDMSYDANGGSTYSVLTSAPNGLPLRLDESRVTDFDVLCYYVNSPLFPQAKLGLFEQQLQAIRALQGHANVTCTKPIAATITLSDSLAGWVGMPGTAMVDDLRATSKASFQAFGNNNCTFGERGGPIFSSTVDADAVFFGAWNASNVPAQSFPSINRRNCSSFVAYKNLGTNAQKLWINATGRAVAFTGFSTFDWEYQTRLLSDGTTTTCQVGVVPNSGNFSPTLTTSNCVGQVLFAPAQ